MGDNRGPQMLGIIITLYTTSIISGLLRFYTHGVIIKRFFAEDILTLIALLIFTAYSVFGILAVSYGLGKHTKDELPERRPTAIMYRWLASLTYILVSLLTKWIVGLFLLRICPQKRWRQIVIWTILGSVTVFSILYFFFDIWSCQPIQYEWTRYNPQPPTDGACNATTFATVTTYIAAVLNIIADWVLPALPATLVWQANIERRVKISVIALLCLSSAASIATIARVPYARGLLDNPDYLYTATDLGIWSTVEIGVALTASSLATLKPLLRKMRLFNMSAVLHYGSSSRGRTEGTANATQKRVSHHVKTFSTGNHHVTISASPPAQDTWSHKKATSKGWMELSLVAKVDDPDDPAPFIKDKTAWLDV